MPDALSKTVPIWCAVINQLLFGSDEVHMPEDVVGPSERSQIQRKVGIWVAAGRVSRYPKLDGRWSRLVIYVA